MPQPEIGGFAALQQQGREGRNGCPVLASQSKSSRQASKCPAAKARKRRLRHARNGLPANGPYCRTWLSEPSRNQLFYFALAAALSCLLALAPRPSCSCCPVLANQFQAWRTERASEQRPVLPNVAFWTCKVLGVFLLLPLLFPAFLLLLLSCLSCLLAPCC